MDPNLLNSLYFDSCARKTGFGQIASSQVEKVSKFLSCRKLHSLLHDCKKFCIPFITGFRGKTVFFIKNGKFLLTN